MRCIAWFAAGVAVVLAGCATPPQTPQGVRAAQQPPHVACSPLSVDEAASRVRKGWERCLNRPSRTVIMPAGPTIAATTSARPWLRVEQSGEITSVLVMIPSGSSFHHSAVFLVDIQSTPACTAQVTSRGWNEGWNRYAASSSVWLDDPAAMPDHCRQ